MTEIPVRHTDDEVLRWIWKNLVPSSGQTDTVQGELLRAIERLRWEGHNNGNGSWDAGFERFVDYLSETLGTSGSLSPAERTALGEDLERLRDFEQPYLEDDLFDRVGSRIVTFARANPEPISRAHDPDQYRQSYAGACARRFDGPVEPTKNRVGLGNAHLMPAVAHSYVQQAREEMEILFTSSPSGEV